MATTMKKMGLRTFNNAKPKTMPIDWYDKDNAEEQKAWDATPDEDRDRLVITYSREKYTARLEREMNQKMKAGLPGGMLSVMLCKVLVDWELYHFNVDEDGNIDEADTTPLILSPREWYDVNGKWMGDAPEGTYEPEEELVIQAGEKIPLTARCLDQVTNIAGMARIAGSLAEDNRPNAKKSGSSGNTF